MDERELLRNLVKWYRAAGINTYFSMRSDILTSRRRVKMEETVKRESKLEMLNKLREEIGDCKRCELYKTRRNLVFGEGNPEASLMFVGEAPGEEEDKQGRPFVGQAGKLLTRLIESIGMTRDEVYIANVLKCRPPGNRNPKEEEIEACSPFLFKQIEIIQPKIICALGAFAAKVLVGGNIQVSKVRGRLVKGINGWNIFPTYHPAYLLRNTRQKKVAIEDFLKLKELLNSEL